MSSYLGYGSSRPATGNVGGAGGGYGTADGGRERGARRRKLAAMAGRVYNAGATAVNEIRESYNQTRAGQMDLSETSKMTIPGSFPDVAIVSNGSEQMVLFPSYAKRHVKNDRRQFADPAGPPHTSSMGVNDDSYWRQEWARHEDEKAAVDVDVRGWVYSPHKGPITRRNRLLIGLARQLSGIPVPRVQHPDPDASISTIHQQHEEEREQRRIAQEAKEIERRGQNEKEYAQQGRYSEQPKDMDSEDEMGSGMQHHHRSSSAASPVNSPPTSPRLGARRTNTAPELNEAELALANANLMARLAPFMTTPLVQMPITVFFYNDTASQSRTVMTDDSGHFVLRAALEFVPTHVRVLANEDLSATERVQIIEQKGVSLISDVDDTIKHSNVSLGAREMFRNTFVSDLKDMTVEGVREWYGALYDLGVSMHYCSNSPWQLFPVIATFFKLAHLPPGSIHLKRYSGMLHGIFEPVAERKKGTLEKILHDFPERKFLLVGDSGEADLEVYTDIAVANPRRIVAIFIRDVTTPEQTGYFDSAFDQRRIPSASSVRNPNRSDSSDEPSRRPALPSRMATEPQPQKTEGPAMGNLIDFSNEPAEMKANEPWQMPEVKQNLPAVPRKPTELLGRRAPPPRPAKPVSLQSSPALPVITTHEATRGVELGTSTFPPQTSRKAMLPPPPRPSSTHPLSQMQNSSEQTIKNSQQLQLPTPQRRGDNRVSSTSSNGSVGSKGPAPPLPPPRRRGTPSSIKSLSPRLMAAKRRSTANSDVEFEPLGPSRLDSNSHSNHSSPPLKPGSPTMNKKLELWRLRLQRAHETLDREGVQLYTWRRGQDVVEEAVGIVENALREMDLYVGEGEQRDRR